MSCITGSWQPWQLRPSSTQQKQRKERSQSSLLPWPLFSGFCPHTATGLGLVRSFWERHTFSPTCSQLHHNLKERTSTVRLPTPVVCYVCCIATCIYPLRPWLAQSRMSIPTRHAQDHGAKPWPVLWEMPRTDFDLLIQHP